MGMSAGSLMEVKLRTPEVEDGVAIWKLIQDTGVLDLNSGYSYLMLCNYFAETCAVAEAGGNITGFASCFKPPEQPDTLFIWQIAVNRSERGKGLAKRLLNDILGREVCRSIRYIEATVSPSNLASDGLFKGMARDLRTVCEISAGFPAELFPLGKHEAEPLYRIGPFERI